MGFRKWDVVHVCSDTIASTRFSMILTQQLLNFMFLFPAALP